MNIYKKNSVGITKLFIIVLCLFYGCSATNETENAKSPFPENGELCFKTSALPTAEYIHMKFQGKAITGKMYLQDEQMGGYFLDFEGTLESDTTMTIELLLNNTKETEYWTIHLMEHKMMMLENSLKRQELMYEIIDCSSLPDLKEYKTLQEMAEADAGEYEENGYKSCYESISSSANKRSTMHEYIALFNTDGAITGQGSGYDEGGPAWDFNFSGSMVNDSTVEVKVNYTQEKTAPFSTSETWIIDTLNEVMHLKNAVPGRPGADRYFKLECVDLPSVYQRLLENNEGQ